MDPESKSAVQASNAQRRGGLIHGGTDTWWAGSNDQEIEALFCPAGLPCLDLRSIPSGMGEENPV